jgi:hypothetical protein
MKKPTFEAMQLAADWLESNDGDEAPTLKTVSAWLREIAGKAMLDAEIRKLAIAQGVNPADLTPSVMNRIRSQLVAKYGKPDPQALSR